MEISKKLCVSNNVLLIRNRKIGQKFFSFENFESSKNLTPFPRIGKNLKNSCRLLLIQKLAKSFFPSRISKVPRIGKNLKNSWKIPVDFSWYKNWPKVFLVREFRRFQEFYVIFKNFEDSKNLTPFLRIGKIGKILRSISCRLTSFLIQSRTIFRKFRRLQEFSRTFWTSWNSWKNFSINLLSTYVLLIRKIGQKFLSFENFEISKNFQSSWTNLLNYVPPIQSWNFEQEKFLRLSVSNVS